jgi:hypothetical protein
MINGSTPFPAFPDAPASPERNLERESLTKSPKKTRYTPGEGGAHEESPLHIIITREPQEAVPEIPATHRFHRPSVATAAPAATGHCTHSNHNKDFWAAQASPKMVLGEPQEAVPEIPATHRFHRPSVATAAQAATGHCTHSNHNKDFWAAQASPKMVLGEPQESLTHPRGIAQESPIEYKSDPRDSTSNPSTHRFPQQQQATVPTTAT